MEPLGQTLAPRDGPEAGTGAGLGVGGDDVGGDADRLALVGHGDGQPDHAGLGHRVHGALVEPAVGGARRHVHEPAAAARRHRPPRRAAHVEGAQQLGADHGGDVLVGELGEGLHAHLAGVVDDHVERAEGVEGGGHDGLAPLDGGDGVVVGHGLAARRP